MLTHCTPSPIAREKQHKVKIWSSRSRGTMQPQAQALSPRITTKYSKALSRSLLQDASSEAAQVEPQIKFSKPGEPMPDAQDLICSFFLKLVKQKPSELVLKEFEYLFVNLSKQGNSYIQKALNEIILSKEEQEFKDTLKRSCYILINNWAGARNYKPIRELIQLLSLPTPTNVKLSSGQKIVRSWLINFCNSQDYEELKIFAAKYESREKEHWKCRYASYLLAPQYVNCKNSIEQRQAAKVLAKQLQEQFKFELAMYTARPQLATFRDSRTQNPTALGDEALRLIKTVVAKRGSFSYTNIANIFLQQTQKLNYKDFKQSLLKYLVFSERSQGLVEALKTQLGKKLEGLYATSHEEELDSHHLLKTCNRVIEFLTTEKQGEPSPLFVLLASQGNPLTLAILLLKILLISRHTRIHLEICIAKLIQYYEGYSQEECHWVINFLEILKILLTVYTENVQYNLVNMDEENSAEQSIYDEKAYRVFSQSKGDYSHPS